MTGMLGFDPRLPDLPLIHDLAAVGRLFERRWEAEGQPAAVRSARLQDVKYQPGRRCVATYTFGTEGPGGAEQTIGVVELTPDGPACRLYADDPQLPAIREAADPARMAPRFAALLGGVVRACTAAPVRYRPGVRCVFRYEVETRRARQVVFGKLLAAGAPELVGTLQALHRASRERPAMPRVLPPVAFWPELGLVAQAEVAGRAELNDLAFRADGDAATREGWLRDAGARLAALHALANVAGPARTMQDDLDELREYLAPMAAADEPLAGRYGAALERIAAQVGARDEPTLVASHGAFRTDQFMIDGNQLVMIDLDGFCWANPARDVGNFLAYLRWKAVRQPHNAALIARAGELFTEGYRAAGGTVDADWLAAYEADSLLKIAGRRYRSLTVKEWPLVPHLIEAAEALVG